MVSRPNPARGPIGAAPPRASLILACALGLLLALRPGPASAQTPPSDQDAAGSQSEGQPGDKKQAEEKKQDKREGGAKKPEEKKPAGKKEPAATPVARPATGRPAEKPLSFTDDDLKKLHGPEAVPAEDGGEEAPAVPSAGAPAGAAASQGAKPGMPGAAARPAKPPSPAPGAPQYAPLVRTPLVIAKPPSQDPLKTFKDREAREKFRAQQIQQARDDVARIQSRLDYLRRKRLGIVNPLVGLPQGQTDEDRANDSTLKPKDLLDQVDAEIKSLEADLEEAQGRLVELETRFGGEAESR